MQLTFGSLFAGIGGFDLGLERAGLECRWQVEIEPYCQQVLQQHWPHVGQWDDIRTFPPSPAEEWRVDVLAGGFPCQDISNAGKGAGLAGERSGLFYEVIRVARVLRPRAILLENVAALLSRGLGTVLGELAAIGFDAEWHCIPAAYVGAPHIRDRVFILAHADSCRCEQVLQREGCQEHDTRRAAGSGCLSHVSNADEARLSQRQREGTSRRRQQMRRSGATRHSRRGVQKASQSGSATNWRKMAVRLVGD